VEHWRKPHFSPYVATPPSEWRILDYGHYYLTKPNPHGGRAGIGPHGLFRNSAGQPYDPQPGVIWTVEEYQKQQEIYKKLGRPCLPGLIAGSPACDSYLAEMHFKNVMGDAKTFADVLAGQAVSTADPSNEYRRAFNQLILCCDEIGGERTAALLRLRATVCRHHKLDVCHASELPLPEFVRLIEEAQVNLTNKSQPDQNNEGQKTPVASCLYDAFISYRHQEPDRTFSRQLLGDLEAAGYKIAIDERDFKANATFLGEMERCIRQSRFTLAIVSPNYLASGNCEEEAVICKVLDMTERRRRLLPLTIEKVQIPLWLYNIVGIDYAAAAPLMPPFEKLRNTLGTPLREPQAMSGPADAEDAAAQAQQTICDTQLDTREETDSDIQRKFMKMAIDEARKCKPEDCRLHPRVGAVVVKSGVVLAKAHRGELESGDHAEYTAMEKKLPDEVIAGATIYTTLEPCTTRNHPKVPCAHRLSERKVSRVVIGMLDPNPTICGKGFRKLRDANIGVNLFDDDLKAQIEEMNRDFIRYHTSAGASTDEGERASSPTTATVAAELDPIECACRAACGCAAGVDELREVWNSQIDAPEEIAHFEGIVATVLRLVYHIRRSKDLFPPVATVVRAVRPEPPAPLLGVPSGASYHDMAIAKAEQTLWCFSPYAHCGKEVLDLTSSTAPVVVPAELQRLFNDESPGSLRDRITKKLQEARRVPFLWDQLCKSMQRIEKFDAVALVAAIEHEAALAKVASGRQLPA
jgi:pyrimidine deaminase RibD-like protein